MKSLNLTIKLALAATLTVAATATYAAGPLRVTDGSDPQPLRWNTANGSIPVYTDGGPTAMLDGEEVEVFTFDFDGTTPFITIDRADEVTQFAFEQWNNVASATFEANVAGTIEDQIGLADVNVDTADQVYFTENGYGFWVVYDTDGQILSDLFGVSPTSVLGIAFPEFGTEDGEIVEATALMNGFAVNVNDPNLDQFAGVFTHEFGHAINLAHTQTNGHIAYFNIPNFRELEPGVKGCGPFPSLTDAEHIETMYPFIDSGGIAGTAQSTVNHPDDIASLSDLYPSSDYASSTGSISGTLFLKDERTEYTGVNIIARNVNDLYGDAVSGLTGDLTQGKIGPDGSFIINNLTPGAEYVLYIEQIFQGGFSTTPQQLVSEQEYWNVAESSDPATDLACDVTPIQVAAGETAHADIIFNGYLQGIQYTPIVSAFLTDLAKNGRAASGVAGSTAFVWEFDKGFTVLPEEFKAVSGNSPLSKTGTTLMVQNDADGNGIQQATLFDFTGRNAKVTPLGDLNGDTCGGGSANGVNSSQGYAVDALAKTAVGLAYKDVDGNGSCQSSFNGEIVPWIWDAKGGMRELDTTLDFNPQFVRANSISGDGNVVLGLAGFGRPMAWIDEGPIMNLRDMFNATEANAVNADGSRVAMLTAGTEGRASDGVLLWNPQTGDTENIGGLTWCEDLDFVRFGTNLCEVADPVDIQNQLGPIAVIPFDMNDDGTVIIGRAGSFFTGFVGGMWIQDIGWLNLTEFFEKQGVAEAFSLPMDNPFALDGNGSTMMGGVAGITFSWLVEMDQVFVCANGKSRQVGFPNGLRNAVSQGAEFGRCEFLD